MKKFIILLSLCLLSILNIYSQRSVDVKTPGTLSEIITSDERSEITSLIITGKINALDFRFLRDFLPNLSTLDLTNVKITEYNGKGGPLVNCVWLYPANTIPCNAFENNKSIKNISIPLSITCISNQAFSETNLSSIVIPDNVEEIGVCSFLNCDDLRSVTIGEGLETISSSSFKNCEVTEIVNNSVLSVTEILANTVITTEIETTTIDSNSIYYNLSGIIVTPTKGLYIVVNNGQSKKVFIQ